MSETTQILFNSPALHSLKRDQLVKLCKIHAIKANGKNVDLIQRLKLHALSLPHDDPLSIAARSESSGIIPRQVSQQPDDVDDDSDLPRHQMPRPSEQWEIVMESIEEVEETASSQGTLTSLRTLRSAQGSGEFGTSSSKASTVSSSIRALATTLGLKKDPKPTSIHSSKDTSASQLPDDELTQHSIPYSAIRPATPPLDDNFSFDPKTASHTRMSVSVDGEPLPGCSLRPGVPAPDNARLSMGLGLGAPSTPMKQQATTTIRLVSNPSASDNAGSSHTDIFRTPNLKPIATSFDLVLSPGGQANTSSHNGFWAPDTGSGHFQSMYPTLTASDLPPALPPSLVKPPSNKEDTSRNILTAPTVDTTTIAMSTPTKPNPFVFGSPLPQHGVSNNQFRTAAVSVLEEMNRRLKSEGVDGVGMDIINKIQPGAHNEEQHLQREVKPLPSRLSAIGGRGGIAHKFDELHKAEFSKMEGIDGVAKRKGMVSPKKSGLDVPPIVGKKRKSSVLGEADAVPRRPITGPGTGGRTSGTTRVISHGRRAKAFPGAFGDDGDDDDDDDEGQEGMGSRDGKRVKIDPEALATGHEKNKDENAMDVDKEDQEEEKRKEREREREAIKRKLEASRAKRKSSVGVGAAAARRRSGRVSGVLAPKPKPSRFGFLASAKNLVASVWNRGKAAPATNIPKPASITGPMPPAIVKEQETPKKPNLLRKTTPGFVPTKSSTTVSVTSGTGSSRLSIAHSNHQQMPAPSARSRSPIPTSFSKIGTASSGVSSSSSKASSGGVAGSRISRMSSATSVSSKNSKSSAGVSSIGTRLSSTSNSRSMTSTGIGSLGTKNQPTPRTSSVTSHGATSRLFAPTASSLAKTRNGSNVFVADNTSTTSSTAAGAVGGEGRMKKKSSLLGPITNSPRMQRRRIFSPTPSVAVTPLSPRSPPGLIPAAGKIFSRPAASGVSNIPVLSPRKPGEGDEGSQEPDDKDNDANTKSSVPTRQRTITRKPRISRSKVIARLASQRAGTSSSAVPTRGAGAGTKPRSSAGAGLRKRPRSSLGARPGRASLTGTSSGAAGKEKDVLASAKKRARQSEYARRRSRVSGAGSDI